MSVYPDIVQALNVNPAAPKPEVSKLKVSPRRGSARRKVLCHPVPVIAPPIDYAGGLSVSPESLAITRLKRFLERESDQRSVEGFSADLLYSGTGDVSMIDSPALAADTCAFWEGALGIGGETRLKVVEWLLKVRCLSLITIDVD